MQTDIAVDVIQAHFEMKYCRSNRTQLVKMSTENSSTAVGIIIFTTYSLVLPFRPTVATGISDAVVFSAGWDDAVGCVSVSVFSVITWSPDSDVAAVQG